MSSNQLAGAFLDDERATAATILRKAADVIDQRGWAKGKAVDEFGRVCAIGAIWTAATGDAYGGPIKKDSEAERAGSTTGRLFSVFVADLLDRQGYGVQGGSVSSGAGLVQPVPFWNDRVCQGPEEAKAVLRAAADAVEAVNHDND